MATSVNHQHQISQKAFLSLSVNADSTEVLFVLFLKGRPCELCTECSLGREVIPLFNCSCATLLQKWFCNIFLQIQFGGQALVLLNIFLMMNLNNVSGSIEDDGV